MDEVHKNKKRTNCQIILHLEPNVPFLIENTQSDSGIFNFMILVLAVVCVEGGAKVLEKLLKYIGHIGCSMEVKMFKKASWLYQTHRWAKLN